MICGISLGFILYCEAMHALFALGCWCVLCLPLLLILTTSCRGCSVLARRRVSGLNGRQDGYTTMLLWLAVFFLSSAVAVFSHLFADLVIGKF